jgi:hypothetical protein
MDWKKLCLSSLGRNSGKLRQTVERLPSNLWYGFERTTLGTEIGFGDSKNWYAWRFFDVVASAPALPNYFMAFAPNDRSYHAVRMNIPLTSEGRKVISGFIRSGCNRSNFISINHHDAEANSRLQGIKH